MLDGVGVEEGADSNEFAVDVFLEGLAQALEVGVGFVHAHLLQLDFEADERLDLLIVLAALRLVCVPLTILLLPSTAPPYGSSSGWMNSSSLRAHRSTVSYPILPPTSGVLLRRATRVVMPFLLAHD